MEAKKLLKDMKSIDKMLERYKIEYALNKDEEYRKLIDENRKILLQKKKIVTKCMNKMSAMNQAILSYKYFDGMTNEEIADEINYSPRATWDKVDEAVREFVEIYNNFA